MLMGFVALGTFVDALAAQSAVAWVIGAAFLALMAATVVGFRVGMRKRAESNDSGMEIEGANIWIRPLRQKQIDKYLASYRNTRDNHGRLLEAVAVPGDDPTRLIDRQAA
jgi:hypothetical protein